MNQWLKASYQCAVKLTTCLVKATDFCYVGVECKIRFECLSKSIAKTFSRRAHKMAASERALVLCLWRTTHSTWEPDPSEHCHKTSLVCREWNFYWSFGTWCWHQWKLARESAWKSRSLWTSWVSAPVSLSIIATWQESTIGTQTPLLLKTQAGSKDCHVVTSHPRGRKGFGSWDQCINLFFFFVHVTSTLQCHGNCGM